MEGGDFVYLAQKIELKPNKDTKLYLNQCFGYSRYIFNKALNEWQEMYDENTRNKSFPKPTHRLIRDRLKNIKEEWEDTLPKMILETSCEDLGKAFNMFFKKISKYPNFKSKKRQNDSCRFFRKNDYTLQVKDNNYLKVSGFPFMIKMKEELKINGIIKEITLSRKADKYFASFIVDSDIIFKPIKNNKYVGVDLGIKTLAVCNDSDDLTNEYKSIIKDLIPLYKQIDYYNKRMSKKDRTSNRYNVMKSKLQRIYLKISNTQKDYIHKVTTSLIKSYQYITIEDLSISNMIKNRKLSKVISRSLFYSFRMFLEYKALRYNNTIIKADRWFPSSQICSACGQVLEGKDKLKLSDRTYKCSCDNEIDRDTNAAINLKLYGMRQVGLQPK